MTVLDLQLKSLRDAAIKSISQVATRMKEEATDVKATIGDIEDWVDRIKQLAEEVKTRLAILCKHVYRQKCLGPLIRVWTEVKLKQNVLFVFFSLRTACPT